MIQRIYHIYIVEILLLNLIQFNDKSNWHYDMSYHYNDMENTAALMYIMIM